MAKRKAHDVRTMCKILGIARSEYYYQINKKENRYKEANEKLDKEILKEYKNSKGRYGSPKIQKALEKRGIRASQKRISRRMKKMGLKSIIVKKYRPSGSKGKVDDTNKPNLLAQNFNVEGLREKLVSDITYIYTQKKD